MLALRGCCRQLLAASVQHSHSLSTTCAVRGLEELIPPLPPATDVIPTVQHGRAWKAAELRIKSFDDLHKLWWVLLKERNNLNAEMMLYRAQGREMPSHGRLKCVRKSMARIKLVLSERAKAETDEVKRREMKNIVDAS